MNSTETIPPGFGPSAQDDQQFGDHWDSLAAILAREIDVYGELSALCLEERDVVVGFSAEALLENNSRKETILLKARFIEESRVKVVVRIAESLGIASDGVDLSTLIDHADPNHKEILRDCQLRLRGILEELEEINENNKLLLDTSLLYVQKSIGFISRLMTPSLNYGDDGELKLARPSGRILCRKG